jgi:hypothetical protein
MDQINDNAGLRPSLRFIQDEPADTDFFSTHTRLAHAIVSAIEANAEIKVIGLLGRWGSGKSTVARKVIQALETHEGEGFKVFPYDAWLHQSDPLRRSFLDSLILRLVRERALSRRWIRRLKKFSSSVEDTRTIETPELTNNARWLGLSLLAVPVGVGLLGFDTFDAAFGAQPTWLGKAVVTIGGILIFVPVLASLGLYLARRPWQSVLDSNSGILRQAFWRDLDEEGEPVRTFQIFTDHQAKRTSTRTFRKEEPTSLEFGREFQRAMREIQKGGHRLVIVIDNLDRVAEEEALGMWATIRSFFLAADDTEDGRTEPFHPTVILPIDRHAIEDLFAGSENGPGGGRERARSFMDKTFDITFEVTEPIHSDWRLFLHEQMKYMFGDLYEESWGFWTRRLFETQLARQLQSAGEENGRPPAVTPREINKLLNRIGALYLQWAEAGIPVEVMALYVIRRDEIDRGLLAFLQSESVEIAGVASNWERELAALHYGVEPAKAGQVLLDEPIRTAILRGDEAAGPRLAAVPGFGETFEFITETLPDPPSNMSEFSVLANAALLLYAVGDTKSQWAVSAWRKLVAVFIRLAPQASTPVRSLSVVNLLAGHAEPDARPAFVANAAQLIARHLAEPSASAADATAVRMAAEQLVAFAEASKLPLPEFALALDPQPFLMRLSALSGGTVWRQLRATHDGAILGEALKAMLATSDVQKSVPNAVRLFTLNGGTDLYEGDIEFDDVAEAAERLVRDPSSMGGDAASGVRVLADLSYGAFDEGEARLRALIEEGVLSARLDEAVAAAEWKNVALMVALMVWQGSVLKAPSAMSWRAYAERDPQHLDRIITILRSYFANRLVSILWSSHGASYANETFVESLIGYAVQNDLLGGFDPVPVRKSLHEYRRAVPYRYRDAFLDQVHRRSNLLTSIEAEPLGPQLAEAVDYMTRRGGEDAEKAINLVRERVRNATVEEWGRAIRLGHEPYGFSQRVAEEEELLFDAKSSLNQALIDVVAVLVGSGGRDVRDRWFALLRLMKPRQAKALQQALGVALEKAAPDQALKILMTGGASFLKAGGFGAAADRAIRTVIMPQLDRKDGREWLRENRDELASWVSRASDKTSAELKSGLKSLGASKLEERRYTADYLSSRWNLK